MTNPAENLNGIRLFLLVIGFVLLAIIFIVVHGDDIDVTSARCTCNRGWFDSPQLGFHMQQLVLLSPVVPA